MFGVIPALHALVKQWHLERNPRNVPAPLADAAQTTAYAQSVSAVSLHCVNKGTTMNTNLNSSRRFASMLLLSVVLASCASSPSTPSPELLQRIEAARTRGDYEALSTYYDQQAAASRAIAAEHGRMAKSYQAMSSGGRGSASMPAHCNAIARMNEGLAAEYEGMAVAYRQLAKQAQP